MKIFSAILALYMTALFVMPCADRHAQADLHQHADAEAIPHQDSHDHDTSADGCSPFCVCSCCGKVSGIVFQWSAVTLSAIKTVELMKPNPPYIQLFIPQYFGEIWQPPQINA